MICLKIHELDNVGVLISDVSAGQEVLDGLVVAEVIRAGHKIALCSINKGEPVIKYGCPIGRASGDISAGEHVHTHNLKTAISDSAEYIYSPVKVSSRQKPERTFMGYRRPAGNAGVRNEIFVVPTVGCIAKLCETIAVEMNAEAQKCCDGIIAVAHPYGCSQLGDDHNATKKLLASLCHNPNVGGVLVVGLGCENNRLDEFISELAGFDVDRFRFLNCQDISDEKTEAKRLIAKLLDVVKFDKREEVPISELTVGLKCGGSDGFSGITANPLVGAFCDNLTAMGGSAILTEVPEMFGAETLLFNRAADKDVFTSAVSLINDFKKYFQSYNQPVYENPSPGNKDGGISTLEEKSLGCTQKSGQAEIVDVLQYGERVRKKGLSLLCSPGNDLVATTALCAAGASIVLFTTGRGTPFGGMVPTVKISTNTELYNKKTNWIDFDAGGLMNTGNLAELALKFEDFIVEIASGSRTKSEENGYREIAIFKNGVTL